MRFSQPSLSDIISLQYVAINECCLTYTVLLSAGWPATTTVRNAHSGRVHDPIQVACVRVPACTHQQWPVGGT